MGSSSKRATWMSERETAGFLATVPLLQGRDDADLLELARVLRRRAVSEGEVLWNQGESARELVFIVEGGVSASLHVPGDRVVEIARAGPGLLAEGTPSAACYLTITGPVEKVLPRGDRRVRVGLAGPGKAFGYEGLIDGRPSPITAITRERALLLVLPRH